MSLALARKYRPKRFADVAVQSHVSATLKGAIARGRVAHGYLLCGPRGTGKTTLARVLAMALNCERKGLAAAETTGAAGGSASHAGSSHARGAGADAAGGSASDEMALAAGLAVRSADGEPCGQCPSCVHIWRGETSLDVIEIDAASNRGVDDARELRERAMYAPSGDDRYKVYIVDEAHMLTREAWNALLKILEEPPPRVVFVFATTEPQKIAQTAAPVLSRLQRFDLKRIGAADIRQQLQRVLGEEQLDAEPEALAMVARAADGSMRDALSLTDQVLAMGDGKVTAERVREALGLVPEDEFLSVLDLVAERRAGDVFEVVGRLADAGMDFGGFLGGLADMLRAQLAIVLGGAAPDVSERTRDALVAGRERFSAPDLLRMLHALADVEPRFRRSGQQQLLLETLLVRLALMDRSVELEDLLRGLGGEGGLGGGGGGGGSGGRGAPAARASSAAPTAPSGRGMSAAPTRDAPPRVVADVAAPAPRPSPRPVPPSDVAVSRSAAPSGSPDDWRAALADVAPSRGSGARVMDSPWGETETGGPPAAAGSALGGGMTAVAARTGGSVELQPSTTRARPGAGTLPALDLNRLVERWDDLADAVRQDKPMLAAALQHATPVSVTARGEVLLELDQPNEMMERAVNGSAAQLVTVLQGWFSGVTRVQIRTAAGASGEPARRLTEQEVRRDQLAVLRRKDPVLAAAIDALDLDLVE